MLITKDGFINLQNKLDLKNEERKELISKREELSLMLGDQSENSDYVALLEEINYIEKQVTVLENQIADSIIAEYIPSKDIIKFGARVQLENVSDSTDIREYQIVGTYEIDVPAGKISNVSPVGSSLLGKGVDDEIDIGEKTYFIKEIF